MVALTTGALAGEPVLLGDGWQFEEISPAAGYGHIQVRGNGTWFATAADGFWARIVKFDPISQTSDTFAQAYGASAADRFSQLRGIADMGTLGLFILEAERQTWYRARDENNNGNALDMELLPPEVVRVDPAGTYANLTAISRRSINTVWLANNGQVLARNVNTFTPAATVANGSATIRCMAFHPQTDAAYLGGDVSGIGCVWRLLGDSNANTVVEYQNPLEAEALIATGTPVTGLAFDSLGQLVVARAGGIVNLWRDSNADQVPDAPQLIVQLDHNISSIALEGTGGLQPNHSRGQSLLIAGGIGGPATVRIHGLGRTDLNQDGHVDPQDLLLWMTARRASSP